MSGNTEQKERTTPIYEAEGIAVFRYIEPRFIKMTDGRIADLYREWSTEQACATWLGVTNRGAEEFCKWAFTAPADYTFTG